MLSALSLAPRALAASGTLTSVVSADARTGKLVRRVVVRRSETPAAGNLAASDFAASPAAVTDRASDVSSLVEQIAAEQQVEPALVHSVIQAESNYNPLAVSNKGAQGLMQLIPSTARRFGVKDSFDSRENIEGGVKYLKYLIGLFHGDYARAVAAYNAGEAAVARFGGVPPYKETQNYVATVSRHLESRRRSLSAAAAAPAEAASPEDYHPILASVTPDGRVYYRTP